MSQHQIRAFRKSLRKFERLNQLLNHQCCRGITMAQCHVLLEIEELHSATTNHLAKNLKLDKSTLSRTVENLVKLKLVDRSENPADRRYKILILTTAGKTLCDTINRENDQLYEKVFWILPPESKEPILDHFSELLRAMESCYEKTETDHGCCE
jgi:DNA-binding MarR family transcriptional regulator